MIPNILLNACMSLIFNCSSLPMRVTQRSFVFGRVRNGTACNMFTHHNHHQSHEHPHKSTQPNEKQLALRHVTVWLHITFIASNRISFQLHHNGRSPFQTPHNTSSPPQNTNPIQSTNDKLTKNEHPHQPKPPPTNPPTKPPPFNRAQIASYTIH